MRSRRCRRAGCRRLCRARGGAWTCDQPALPRVLLARSSRMGSRCWLGRTHALRFIMQRTRRSSALVGMDTVTASGVCSMPGGLCCQGGGPGGGGLGKGHAISLISRLHHIQPPGCPPCLPPSSSWHLLVRARARTPAPSSCSSSIRANRPIQQPVRASTPVLRCAAHTSLPYAHTATGRARPCPAASITRTASRTARFLGGARAREPYPASLPSPLFTACR